MYAIVDIAGQQFKVEKENKLFVHRLQGEEGSTVDFDKILLIDNDGDISVGDPVVKDKVIRARILAHVKGDKVKVFKKKRRKGYQVLNGHRQYFTELVIQGIYEKGSADLDKVEAPVEKKVKAPTEKKEATTKASAKKAPVTTAKKAAAPKAKATATKDKAAKPAKKKDTEKK